MQRRLCGGGGQCRRRQRAYVLLHFFKKIEKEFLGLCAVGCVGPEKASHCHVAHEEEGADDHAASNAEQSGGDAREESRDREAFQPKLKDMKAERRATVLLVFYSDQNQRKILSEFRK